MVILQRKKLLSLMFLFVFCAMLIPTAKASVNALPGANMSATISLSGKTAKCAGSVSAPSRYTINITLSLQKQVGKGWTSIKSVSKSNCNQVEFQYTLVKGTYRTSVSIILYDSDGNKVDSASAHSSSVTVE